MYLRMETREDIKKRKGDVGSYDNIKFNLETLYRVIIYNNKKEPFKSISTFGMILKIVATALFSENDPSKRFISRIPSEEVLLEYLTDFGNEETLNVVLYIISYDLAVNFKSDELVFERYNGLSKIWNDKMPYRQISVLGVIRYYRRWKKILPEKQ